MKLLRPKMAWLVSLLLLVVLAAGCGVAAPEDQTNAELARLQSLLKKAFEGFGQSGMSDDFSERIKPPTRPWHTMTRSQKRRHMDQHVMPVMQAFYSYYFQPRLEILGFKSIKERGSTGIKIVGRNRIIGRLPVALDCQTCHGGGPTDQFEPDFSKPTTLLPLDPENLPTRDDSDPFIAATVKYMEDVVVPAMRIMLDRPTFGCFGCHATKK